MSTTKPLNGEFCWNELMTTSTTDAKEFYGSLLGWESHEMDMGNGMVYTMFKKGDKDIGGMMQIPQDQEGKVPPHWMSYINVDNLEDTVSKAKTLGATVAVPVTSVCDYGKFAVVQDPTGAHTAFWQSLKEC